MGRKLHLRTWNKSNPDKKMTPGDSIVEVNGIRGNVALMLEKCKVDPTLEPGTLRCCDLKRLWRPPKSAEYAATRAPVT